MSSRRVRFSDDSHQSSVPVPIIEDLQEKQAVLEASSRAEQLENVRLAAQRAHDAVMLARSMRADIRSNNAKLQRSGQGSRPNEITPHAHSKSSVTQPIKCTEQYPGPQLLDILKDQEIMAVPMAWISNVLLINK